MIFWKCFTLINGGTGTKGNCGENTKNNYFHVGKTPSVLIWLPVK